MEPICCGWLIKSPPEQKSSGAWKIFGAKWKRRYFVLYAPPLTSAIIGARAAMLEYYSSKKLNTKIGAINLGDCDEVLANLDSDIYKNIFGLHTKHKGRYRTYYLVSDTEEEMNSWVSHLCSVLGLLENNENKFQFSPENRIKSASCILSKPRTNFLTQPNRKNINSIAISLNSSGFSSLSSRLNSSESDLLDSKFFAEDDEKKIKSTGSVPELEIVHDLPIPIPIPTKKREYMELPPIPPEKSRKSLENLVSDGNQNGVKKFGQVSNLLAEECLGAPPPKPPKERKKTNISREDYDVPKPLEIDFQSYDLPKKNLSIDCTDLIDSIQSNVTIADGVYNAPKSVTSQSSVESPPANNSRRPPIPARRKSIVSKNMQHSIITDDEFSPKNALKEQRNNESFYNVPTNQPLLIKDMTSLSFDESSYDVPNPSSTEVLPPILGRKVEKLHKHIDTTISSSSSLADDSDQMYDSPKASFKPVPAKRTQLTSQSTSPPCEPTTTKKPDLMTKPSIGKKSLSMKLSRPEDRGSMENCKAYGLPKAGSQQEMRKSFQKKTPATVVIQDSIRFTQRSKSFKRSLQGSESDEKQMPTKRMNEKEASSDDCYSDDEC